jgi:O-antigen biosynthesis protein
MYNIIKKLIFRFIAPSSFLYKIIYLFYRASSSLSFHSLNIIHTLSYRHFRNTFNLSLPEGLNIKFNRYITNYFPRSGDLEEMKKTLIIFKHKPLISILVPVYNAPRTLLKKTIESVRNQIYENWELCIVDDCSTREETRELLQEYGSSDSRIKIIFKEKNEHICKTTQAALNMATGVFIGLLDHDDCLTPDALYQNVLLIQVHPRADMIYSDEAISDADDTIMNFIFKPDWSPETFLSNMYSCHFSLFRKSLVNKVGGFREGYDGSQDYDLTLRVTEKTKEIYHIPRILYYWRFHNDSVTKNSKSKLYAYEAAKSALNDALARRKEPGHIDHIKKCYGFYQINYNHVRMPAVDIMVSSNGDDVWLEQCLKSILNATEYKKYSISVFLQHANNVHEKEYNSVKSFMSGIQVYTESPANYNRVVSRLTSEYILFIDSRVQFNRQESDWLERLVEHGMRNNVSAVTPLLLMPHRRVYSAGLVLDPEIMCRYKYGDGTVDPQVDHGLFTNLVIAHNVAAVPHELFLTRKTHFHKAGGFDTRLSHPTALSLDLSLHYLAMGMRNICLPFVHVTINAEGPAVEFPTGDSDRVLLKKKWGPRLEEDPYYNRNITVLKNI